MYRYPTHSRFQQDRQQFGGMGLWLLFRFLPTLLVSMLAVLILNASPARGDQEGPPLSEVQGGQMFLGEGSGYQPAVLQDSKVHFDISGMVATVTLQQTFRNDTDRWMEGVYAFPLPGGAAVRQLEMLIGERRIIGKIREKEAARREYQAAKKAGKKASLVEQQRPNMFTNRVANIGPGEEIVVRLEYVQAVSVEGDVFSLRFPTTITPRYIPGVPLRDLPQEETVQVSPALGWALPTDQVLDADSISPYLIPRPGSDAAPNNPMRISARLDMGMPLALVESPYHDIALSRSKGVYDIRLARDVAEMDRDFLLSWQPVSGAAPSAALFTEQVGGEHYGLLMVVPPAVAKKGASMPREIIFVVDTSGSMGGVSIKQARASLTRALQQLHPDDRFNIIQFSSSYRSLFRVAVPASRHNRERAREFVRQLNASGGTEMLPALGAALKPAAEAVDEGEYQALRQVVFITDGAVGNEQALYEQIAAMLGDSRLFTVAIGSAPNSWFMRKAAQFGRGSHTHIGNLDEVEEKMDGLFQQLGRPAARDFKINWPTAVDAWPERLPDLYLGQPLLVAVKFGATRPQGEVVVSADLGGHPWRRTLQLPLPQEMVSTSGHQGVASLWARKKIAALLDERVQGQSEESVRAKVLPLALAHQLLSPYTSFVAVEEIVSRPATEGLDASPLPNTRPKGQSPQQFAYPRTATSAPLNLWLGTLLLFVAMLVWVLRRQENDHVPFVSA
jgi:Ca-activated chloride channel family protein